MKKRIISLVITCALFLSFATPAFATCDHISSENTPAGIEYTVFYEMDEEENIIEYIHFPDVDVTRTVHPDNTMTVDVFRAGTQETTTINSDYALFKNAYLASLTPMPLKSDITGSQFIHQYIGSAGKVTYYMEDIRKYSTASGFAAGLLTIFGNNLGAGMAAIAGTIFNDMYDGKYEKVVLSSNTYAVLFASDRSYFIHCYHQWADFYKEGETRPAKTEWDYYQAIGG